MSVVVTTAQRASGLLYAYAQGMPAGTWLVPANSCPDVPATLIAAGHRVETVDVQSSTLVIDGELLRERVARGPVRGILVISSYGLTEIAWTHSLWSELKSLQPDLKIVWDRCLGYPELASRELLEVVDMELFSTGRAKSLDLGRGGWAVTRQPLKACERAFQQEDLEAWEAQIKHHRGLGTPLAQQSIHCHWLNTGPVAPDYLDQVPSGLGEAVSHRTSLNHIYACALPPEACLPDSFQHWRFNLLTNERETLLQTLFANGLWASGHYQDVSPMFGLTPCPVTRGLGRHVVNLFTDGTYNRERAERTAGLVREHLDKYGFPEWEWEKGALN